MYAISALQWVSKVVDQSMITSLKIHSHMMTVYSQMIRETTHQKDVSMKNEKKQRSFKFLKPWWYVKNFRILEKFPKTSSLKHSVRPNESVL